MRTASSREGERHHDQHRRDCERHPHAGADAFGMGRRDVGRRRGEREHRAHDGGAGDEPEIARQVEQAGDDAPLVRVDIHHDGGGVGRLEQGIAGGDGGDGGDVARMKEPAAIPARPVMVMRPAPRRSTMRPAGTPVSAAISGPTDITRPVASSPSAPDR